MKRTLVLRLVALLLCLMIFGTALAEGLVSEGTIPEVSPFELTGPEMNESDANAAGEQPGTPALPERQDDIYSETVEIDTATFENLNLVRGEGFKGPFAKVAGQLTLKNVTVEGKSPRKVNLLKAFALGPGGRIAVVDGAAHALDLAAFSFDQGETVKLSAYHDGKRLPASRVRWTSSKPKVASVSEGGVVKALKKGSAKITATFEDGSTAACQVLATHIIEAESIALSAAKLNLSLHRSHALTVKFTPSKTTFKDVVWTTSNAAVVSVDEAGTLTGTGAGKAIVTATTINGKSASCDVTVAEVGLKRVDFEKLYVTMHPGEVFRSNAIADPLDTSYPGMTYHSSDEAVAVVDAETGEITAVGCGTATVTVRSTADHSIKNTCKVCVIEPDAPRMAGLIIGINPGHQIKTIKKKYPIAPGSHKKALGVKTGACGKWTRVPEYETVLRIGLKLRKLCQDAGAEVVITRTENDVMLTNIDRAQMLNEAGVDVALQLHCNSISNRRANGNSGYIRTTGDWVEESRALSKAITAAISAECGCVNLGVKVFNEYMSLNWTTTPSVLLEMGYISNYNEDKLLATDDYRQKMAQGIFNGLCEYFGR